MRTGYQSIAAGTQAAGSVMLRVKMRGLTDLFHKSTTFSQLVQSRKENQAGTEFFKGWMSFCRSTNSAKALNNQQTRIYFMQTREQETQA